MGTDAHGQRPAQGSALNQLLQRSNRGAQSVKRVIHTEPGIKPEDTGITLHCSGDVCPFRYRAGHRFFRPDVTACIEGIDILQGMPVRRRHHMHHIDRLAVQHVPEIPVAMAILASLLQGCCHPALHDVANPDQFSLGVIQDIFNMPLPHPTQADDCVIDFVVGSERDPGRLDAAGTFTALFSCHFVSFRC